MIARGATLRARLRQHLGDARTVTSVRPHDVRPAREKREHHGHPPQNPHDPHAHLPATSSASAFCHRDPGVGKAVR